jgi:predicted AlkP superfamily phosphohydrolase/phosphomutase
LADIAAEHARDDSDVAIATAKEFAPDFKPSLLERFEKIRGRDKFKFTAHTVKQENVAPKPLTTGSPDMLETPNNNNYGYKTNMNQPNYVGNSIEQSAHPEHNYATDIGNNLSCMISRPPLLDQF